VRRFLRRLGPNLAYLADFFKTRPLAAFGLCLVSLFLFLTVFGYALAPYDPQLSTDDYLEPPSSKHWLGTDRAGLDIFSRILASPRVDLTIGIAATALSILIGVPFGVISGYMRGWASSATGRVFDVMQCLPPFIVAMCLVAFAGQSVLNVIIVLALLNSPIYVRLVRSKVYSVKQRKFVEAATCTGNSDRRIVFRHLLPNSIEPVLVQFPVQVGWAILMTAALSFVGAGVRSPTPEWGSMIAIGAPLLITGQWWVAVFPGIAVGLCVLGLALLANALEILLDPTRR
jgi:peptide/nickel transport system permease protein